MRNGKALGGPQLRVMSNVAREHLSCLANDEIAALYACLHSVTP